MVEDHWFEGGIGDAVLNAFVGVGEKAPTVVKLAVRSIPTSGTPAELLARLELMPSILRKPSGSACKSRPAQGTRRKQCVLALPWITAGLC